MKSFSALIALLFLCGMVSAIPLNPGTYQVGPGETYETVADVKTALNDGVAGPVIFEFDNSVVWTESTQFGSVTGASKTNTITFQGKGTLATQFKITGSVSNNYSIKIQNGSHYRIKNIDFRTNNSFYGTSIALSSTTTDIVIENCSFTNLVTSGLNPDLAIIRGNESSILDEIYIRNNEFTNGSCGVYLNNFTQKQSTEIIIEKNTFTDNRWHAIALTRYSKLKIDHNTINEPGYTGVYIIDSDSSSSISNNIILNPYKIGINVQSHNSMAISGDMMIYNNVISKPITDGISLQSGQDYAVYHNTIRAEHSPGLSACLRLDETQDTYVKNNIFTDVNGGEMVHMVDVGGLVIFNSNDFGHTGSYVANVEVSPNLPQDLTYSQFVAQHDQNAIDILPTFESISSLKLECSAKLLMNSCSNLGAPFDIDINGVQRDANCTMGANEKKYDYTGVTSVEGVVTVGTDTCKDGKVYLLADISNGEVLDTVGVETLNGSNGGKFLFDNLQNIDYFIKAIPNRSTYPTWLPTYAGGIQEWNISFQLGKDICNELGINIKADTTTTLSGTPLGSIEGVIGYEGTNKASNDPIPGLDIVLDKIPPSKSVMATVTNSSGLYKFDGLPEGTYQVMVDYPGIGRDTLHTVDIYNGHSNLVNLDYCVDTTTKILICGEASHVSTEQILLNKISNPWPNPFNNKINFSIENVQVKNVVVMDILGKIQMVNTSKFNGTLEITFDDQLSSGLYIIQIETNEGIHNSIVRKK